jgi:hypothetical protein
VIVTNEVAGGPEKKDRREKLKHDATLRFQEGLEVGEHRVDYREGDFEFLLRNRE